MKNIAKFMLLGLIACGTAMADTFTAKDVSPTFEQSYNASVPKSLSPAALEVTILESAAAPKFSDYGDGYIGTVYDNNGYSFGPTSGPSASTVPEPASLVLVGSGLALAALRRRILSSR